MPSEKVPRILNAQTNWSIKAENGKNNQYYVAVIARSLIWACKCTMYINIHMDDNIYNSSARVHRYCYIKWIRLMARVMYNNAHCGIIVSLCEMGGFRP